MNTTTIESPRRYNWIRATTRNRCPICQAPDYCGVTDDGAICHCMRVESEKQSSDGGWLHFLRQSEEGASAPAPRAARPAPTIPEMPPEATPLPPDRHDAIARCLSRLLSLSEEHRQSFIARGIAELDIGRHGYRTLSRKALPKILRAVCEEFPVEEVLRLPGVIRRNGRFGPYLTINAPDGILIPTRNHVGLINGFRVRPDNAGPGGKYRWLSSAGVGVASGAPLHVAKPREVFDPGTVYIVEGEIKANIVSDRTRCVTISVPGVTITSAVLPTIEALFGDKSVNLVIAYDSDKSDPSKPSILMAERKLARAAWRRHHVFECQWDPSIGKGLDDVLVAGHMPGTIPYQLPHSLTEEHPEGDDTDDAIEQALSDWSVEPILRGRLEKSKWCAKARLFFMSGSGRITDAPRPCGLWTCGYCAAHKLSNRVLPHIARLWQQLERDGGWIWVGRRGPKDAFNQRVHRSRREGVRPRYLSVSRRPQIDANDTIDLDGDDWVAATEDLGGREDCWRCMAPLDAYQHLRESILCLPGVKQIRFCDQWALPDAPKRDCPDHLAYTSPTILEAKFRKTAIEAEEATGIRPVYREDIPNPEARQIVHDGLRGLRSGRNDMSWGDLADEEHHA